METEETHKKNKRNNQTLQPCDQGSPPCSVLPALRATCQSCRCRPWWGDVTGPRHAANDGPRKAKRELEVSSAFPKWSVGIDVFPKRCWKKWKHHPAKQKKNQTTPVYLGLLAAVTPAWFWLPLNGMKKRSFFFFSIVFWWFGAPEKKHGWLIWLNKVSFTNCIFFKTEKSKLPSNMPKNAIHLYSLFLPISLNVDIESIEFN